MPHALIVDDSKTARYALRLLLDKQHFTTDMVESAEQALDYLNTHAPAFRQ
jgi:CheY-like chemotaxis protein